MCGAGLGGSGRGGVRKGDLGEGGYHGGVLGTEAGVLIDDLECARIDRMGCSDGDGVATVRKGRARRWARMCAGTASA